MVSLDEPAHARLRNAAARAFSATRVTAMIPAITATTVRLLDAVTGQAQFDPPVPVWRRVTARPVTIGGVNGPEGARLFLRLAAAGRDPSVFRQPDLFDPGRPNAGQHLAFGLGLHYCLGASLGKLEPGSPWKN